MHVLELERGAYREVRVLHGQEQVRVTAPFPLELSAADLLLE